MVLNKRERSEHPYRHGFGRAAALMDHRKRAIYNTPPKAKHRKELRNSLTPAEAKLWKCLQNRQLAGKKFRRQFSVGPYIVDFYCPECRLAIELDGAPHFGFIGGEKDARKKEYLENCGIRVIHFENKLIYNSVEWVLEVIKHDLLTVD